MKRLLIVLLAVVAVAAISYSGTGPALLGGADYQSDAQYFSNSDGSLPSGLLLLCAEEEAEAAEEAPAEEEKEIPGVDRVWNVVMYG